MRLIMTQDLRQNKEHEPTHHLMRAAAGPGAPRVRVTEQGTGLGWLDPRPGFGEDGAEDLLHLVEVGLVADQRRGGPDGGVAPVVGAAGEAGGRPGAGQGT